MKINITIEIDDEIYEDPEEFLYGEVLELVDRVFRSRLRGVHRVGDPEIEPDHETNIAFLKRVCETAPSGGYLTQVFALDAIGKLATTILSLSDEELQEAFCRHPLVSWQAWKAAAKDWNDALDSRP